MPIMKPILYFVVFCLILEAISCLGENDNETKVILSHMQDWGKAIFETLTGKTKPQGKGQYLVAAVFSEDDLNTPHKMPARLLKGCPIEGPNKEKQMIMCSTSGVFLNRKSEEIWKKSRWNNDETYRHHTWHGEYILLREGYIQQLVDNCEGNQCQVYLYSYYIPCADISNCPYWCSDEILKYNNRGDTSCRITVIGYTAVFKRPNSKTNKTLAVDNINSARAQLFQNVGDVKMVAINAVHDRNRKVPFQELLFSCLNESPLSGCCISKAGVLSSGSESIIAFYVNYIVFQAINSLNSNLVENSQNDYLNQFYYLIKHTVSSGCNRCPHKMYHKFVTRFCVKTAIKLASGFGAPSERLDMSLPSWTFIGNTWNNLYLEPPEEFLNKKMLFCAERSMSVESLCTRPDYVEKRSREQDEMYESKRSRME